MNRTWQWVAGTALGAALVAGAGLTAVAAREQGPGPGGPGAIGRRGPGGPGGPGRPGGPGGPMAGLPLRGLDLTEAQREQVRAAMTSHKAEFEAQATRMRTAHEALDAVVTAETFDEAAIREKAIAVAAADADGAVLRAKVYSEVWALLTPEQQQKARDLRAKRDARRGELRERFEQRRNDRQQRRQG